MVFTTDADTVGEWIPTDRVAWLYSSYSFAVHHGLMLQYSPTNVDVFWNYTALDAPLIRHGELALVEAAIAKYLELFGQPGALEFSADGAPTNLGAYAMYNHGQYTVGVVQILCGFGEQYLRWASAMGVRSFARTTQYVDTFTKPILSAVTWAVAEPLPLTFMCRELVEHSLQLKLACCDRGAIADSELTELLAARGPGLLCSRGDGSYDGLAAGGPGFCGAGGLSLEAEVRERDGQQQAAIEAAGVLSTQAPHNAVRRALSQSVTLRCQAAMGLRDAAVATFEAAAEGARRHHAYLLAALMVRDYIVGVCDAEDAGREAALPRLGAAIKPLCGAREPLTALLGHGLDAAAAEALAA